MSFSLYFALISQIFETTIVIDKRGSGVQMRIGDSFLVSVNCLTLTPKIPAF